MPIQTGLLLPSGCRFLAEQELLEFAEDYFPEGEFDEKNLGTMHFEILSTIVRIEMIVKASQLLVKFSWCKQPSISRKRKNKVTKSIRVPLPFKKEQVRRILIQTTSEILDQL